MAETDRVSVALISDATLNDSDKTFTVPAGENWELHHIFVELASTATVGNRRVRVEVLDASDNVVARYNAGAVQVASKTGQYNFGVNNLRETAFTTVGSNDELDVPWPDSWAIPSGFKVHVLDVTAVDPAADDLTVRALGDRVIIC